MWPEAKHMRENRVLEVAALQASRRCDRGMACDI